MTQMIDYALDYAENRGWPVFPCHSIRDGACSCGNPKCGSPGKHPLTDHGHKDASIDPMLIKAWWEMWPDANIGFAVPAPMVIVDVDVSNGKHGKETLEALEAEHCALPDTVTSMTGGGGLHMLFVSSEPMKNNNTTLKDIDIKTGGGYIILPPSRHISGGVYHWIEGRAPDDLFIADLPQWFADLYREREPQHRQTALQEGERITDGTRNVTLFKLAASLRAKGLSEEAIYAALMVENAARCDPPKSENEVRTIARSAGRYKQGGVSAGFKKKAVSPDANSEADIPVKPLDFTDTGNAQVFARVFKNKAIYVKSVGWLVWTGRVWDDNELNAREMAIQLTDQMLLEANIEIKAAGDALTAATVAGDKMAMQEAGTAQKIAEAYRTHAKKSRQSSRITGLLILAQALMQVMPDKLDAKSHLLNTPDGMISLRTGEIRTHDPDMYCTKITKCSPAQGGTEIWKDFINTVTNGDAALSSFLQLVSGMAAIGKVFEENLIIALGDGKNGKSALFNSLAACMGNYAGTIDADVLTTANKSKGAELATLKGKRLIIAAETEEGARLSSAMVKQLTSTDRIHAERKYKDPEDFIPTHTIVLYTNHLPRVGSTDSGTWRRLVVAPFTAKISASKEVKNYADKLVREAGGAIMAWIIEGARMFIEAGYRLPIPEAVQNSIYEYKQDNDWLQDFLTECCEFGPGKQVGSARLYSAYRDWADRTGEYKRHAKDFKAEMEKRGHEHRKDRNGSAWYGVQVKSYVL